jgi:hypothetical protein
MILQTIGTAVLLIRQIAAPTPTSRAFKIILGLSVVLSILGWLVYGYMLLLFVALAING